MDAKVNHQYVPKMVRDIPQSRTQNPDPNRSIQDLSSVTLFVEIIASRQTLSSFSLMTYDHLFLYQELDKDNLADGPEIWQFGNRCINNLNDPSLIYPHVLLI